MDSIISAALEVICTEGSAGCSIADLWRGLEPAIASSGLHLSDGVKDAVWKRLLVVPGIELREKALTVSSRGLSVEAAEGSGVRIVAPEHMRDACLGIYDLKSSDAAISQVQRRVLERLAKSRTTGVTQNELAKEFNVSGNKLFYIVKNLECRGLLVRQSATVRMKECGRELDAGNKIDSIVNTNLVHLSRYAKNLNLRFQQRFEIKKENAVDNICSDSGNTLISADCIKEDRLVKDYLPAMRNICSKLDEASNKVLVVSDIKKELGYLKTTGHRAWRAVLKRLKEAHLVEEFSAEVNKKVVSCLRLVKKFDPKNLQQKYAAQGCEDSDGDQIKCAKRGQMTDQLLELPIDRQIYDVIDSAGSNGITVQEVCKKLGINSKKNYHRFTNMVPRFGLHLQPESYKRSMIYRFWTSRNFNTASQNFKHEKDGHGGEMAPAVDGCLSSRIHESVHKCDDIQGKSQELIQVGSLEDQLDDTNTHDVMDEPDTGATGIMVKSRIGHNSSRLQAGHGPPRLALAAENAQREQRILERLKEEKFLIISELHRWLEDIEEKPTMLARKTLTRVLGKLQEEGQCKCISVSVPAVTNCGHSRVTEVILHPSVNMKQPDLLVKIHERLRNFDMETRGQGVARSKKEKSVPILTGVKRTQFPTSSDSPVALLESMHANGYIPAKMVRVKLFHTFLWGYITSLPDWQTNDAFGEDSSELKSSQSSVFLFSLDAATKAMPVELFLQVVGSTKRFEELVESCKHRLRLCELPMEEFKGLMSTQATGRLSNLVDILRRLRLLRLVNQGHDEVNSAPHAVLKYAMELKPYIEEPLQRSRPRLNIEHCDLKPKFRHDFGFSSGEAVDAYWKTLEYCYSAADPTAAGYAFPGSAVPEAFNYRSWSSVRVMTSEQRAELLKRISNDEPEKRIPFKDCVKIARDLNLTLEQVLRVSYDKNRRLSLQKSRKESMLTDQHGNHQRLASCKRKRDSEYDSSLMDENKPDIGEKDLAVGSSLQENYDTNKDHKDIFHSPLQVSDAQLDATANSHGNIAEESLLKEEVDDVNSFISQFAFSKVRPTRQRKFKWTQKADRYLLMQYARYRAAQGAKFHRVDWASLPDLPAPADSCRRRIALLKSDSSVRRAIMNLCNLLGERYAEHIKELEERQISMLADPSFIHQNSSSFVASGVSSSCDLENTDMNPGKPCWDDIEDPCIVVAIDEVLRCKPRNKHAVKGAGLRTQRELFHVPQPVQGLDIFEQGGAHVSNDVNNFNSNPTENGSASLRFQDIQVEDSHSLSPIPGEGNHSTGDGRQAYLSTPGKSKSNNLRQRGKFLKLLQNRGHSVKKIVRKSLAVANAVELIKLVFLNSSATTEVPKLLAETLRRYNEHDIFAAFNYLQAKKFVVVGRGSQPFVLTPKFFESASSSPFPVGTGLRFEKFSKWLCERKRDLMGDGVCLGADLHCGDMFHLFALVSSGEMLISPCLPLEGVGDVDSQVGLKRKIDRDRLNNSYQVKKIKLKSINDGELSSRREKGFPGIQLSLTYATVSEYEALGLELNYTQISVSCTGNSNVNTSSQVDSLCEVSSLSSCSGETTHSASSSSNEPSWESMCIFARHYSSMGYSLREDILCPDLFKTAYFAIYKAADQGLTVVEIGLALDMEGTKITELTVDVLRKFGLVVKVNAFDHFRVVATCYGVKYSLGTPSAAHEAHLLHMVRNNEGFLISKENDGDVHCVENLPSVDLSEGHRVTILHGSDIAVPMYDSAQANRELAVVNSHVGKPPSSQRSDSHKECHDKFDELGSFQPILPWLNGDGGKNPVMCDALTRRILGVVMQNPGILEDDLIGQMDVLNPQSCRKLLESLVLDNHLIVRSMHQTTSDSLPSILEAAFGTKSKEPESVYRRHLFANPTSAYLL
ncbi:uncharacterized protein LOC116260035 isoform X2 [Nymphaea colorata]|uniref:uncharacterized protein LOC116260035 isoform X2 n=1 Tax=Nymphaea colorata TaxID=210225 RepID=UPI00214EEC55|nr:uncharacterized protein LOC116260035 isoform X2 [Nymphaea colorata]